jgi:hypothetical protein
MAFVRNDRPNIIKYIQYETLVRYDSPNITKCMEYVE